MKVLTAFLGRDIQSEITTILAQETYADREAAFKVLAKDLGCAINALYSNSGLMDENEMVRRLQDAARSNREHRLWLVALLSALIAVLSTVASVVSAWAAFRAIDREEPSQALIMRLLDENQKLRQAPAVPAPAKKQSQKSAGGPSNGRTR